jgi:hypothetical protein
MKPARFVALTSVTVAVLSFLLGMAAGNGADTSLMRSLVSGVVAGLTSYVARVLVSVNSRPVRQKGTKIDISLPADENDLPAYHREEPQLSEGNSRSPDDERWKPLAEAVREWTSR